MKLSEYAKLNNIGYRAAWNRFKQGKIKSAFQNEFGTVIVPEHVISDFNLNHVALYSRVSSNQNKENLKTQSDRLKSYACAKGYNILFDIKEVGSGINDNRVQLIKLLKDRSWGTLIVEHSDRLSRFGVNYIKILIESQGRKLEITNTASDEKTDLIQDLVSIIYSFSARLYGLRKSKRNTEKIILELEKLKNESDKDNITESIKNNKT